MFTNTAEQDGRSRIYDYQKGQQTRKKENDHNYREGKKKNTTKKETRRFEVNIKSQLDEWNKLKISKKRTDDS